MKSTISYRHVAANLSEALDIPERRDRYLRRKGQEFLNPFNESGSTAKLSEAIEFAEEVSRTRREFAYLTTLLVEAITTQNNEIERLNKRLAVAFTHPNAKA